MVLLSLATGCWNFNLYHWIISTIASESWFRLMILVIPVTSFGNLQINWLSHLIISIEWRSIKTYASRDCRCRQFICDEIVAMKPHWRREREHHDALSEQFLTAMGIIWISEIGRTQRLLWADQCILTILVLCCYLHCAPGFWTSVHLVFGHPCIWVLNIRAPG